MEFDDNKPIYIQIADNIAGRILSGEIHAKNDFTSSPVQIRSLEIRAEEGGEFSVTLPPCSVAEITLS